MVLTSAPGSTILRLLLLLRIGIGASSDRADPGMSSSESEAGQFEQFIMNAHPTSAQCRLALAKRPLSAEKVTVRWDSLAASCSSNRSEKRVALP